MRAPGKGVRERDGGRGGLAGPMGPHAAPLGCCQRTPGGLQGASARLNGRGGPVLKVPAGPRLAGPPRGGGRPSDEGAQRLPPLPHDDAAPRVATRGTLCCALLPQPAATPLRADRPPYRVASCHPTSPPPGQHDPCFPLCPPFLRVPLSLPPPSGILRRLSCLSPFPRQLSLSDPDPAICRVTVPPASRPLTASTAQTPASPRISWQPNSAIFRGTRALMPPAGDGRQQE